MASWAELILLVTSPILIVMAGARLGPAGTWWSHAAVIAVGAIAPGALLFLASRDADAITSAAGYVVAPMVALFWGLPAAGITALLVRR